MTVSGELVRQEVSELYRFIEPMVRLCSELRPDYPVFSNESQDFFKHIRELGEKTLKYLEDAPNNILKDPRLSPTRRQELQDLRYLWESLHEFLRPALDADSLHLPNSLIAALHDRVHETGEWQTFRFTLFHTAEANYLQVPTSMVGQIADNIAALVGVKQFPPDLGHVGIPYSQADGLFLNCTLAHEMGHFIYQREVISDDAEDKIDDALDRMVKEIGDLDDAAKSLCVRLVGNWIQEIFCDLFAVCLIGPAYSFAFSQLISATMLIGTTNGVPESFYKFSTSHPADISRFKYHRKLLAKLGWWAQISNWSCGPVQVLKACARDRSSFSLDLDEPLPEELGLRLLQCYDEVCSWLIGEVPKRVNGCRDGIATFEAQSAAIADYLQRAIVPSTIIVRGKVIHPKPVTLINAGYKFLFENLRNLLTRIEGEKPDSIESRSRLTGRLELWLLKALEDHRLLTGGTTEQ